MPQLPQKKISPASSWRNLAIRKKFIVVFAVLFSLIIMIAATGYLSAYSIRMAEHTIRKSRDIAQEVLEMDRGMGMAYRSHGDFFLQYSHVGLQKAHELYAQPSIREISQVIRLSNKLNHQLFVAREIDVGDTYQKDINLYLASARRFAETSIESYELLTQRAAPERGVEAQLKSSFEAIQTSLEDRPDLLKYFSAAVSSYKDYLIYRQRPLMQSALNIIAELQTTISRDIVLLPMRKQGLLDRLKHSVALADQLLAIDLAIAEKMHDFQLQREILTPISATLIALTKEKAAVAEQRIDRVHDISGAVILLCTLLALAVLLYTYHLMHSSITQNVLNLAGAATAFSHGHLDARVPVASEDELGRLSVIFNNMADHLKSLIENLEEEVSRRTEDLVRSEERFRQLVMELPNIAVQGFDSDRGVVYWNRTSELLFGYSSDEAMGRPVDELIVPKPQRSAFCEALRKFREGQIPVFASEMELQQKNGQTVPVFAAFVMQVDSTGEKTMFCISIDLAELKKSQANAEKSETFYRQLFDHSSSGVMVFEPYEDGRDFIIRDFNRAAERIERLARGELIGRPVTEAFPGIEETGLLDTFRRVLRTGQPAHAPAFYYHDERISGWREYRIYRMPTEEVVAVYDDITSRKLAEEEKRTLESSLQRAQKMEAIGHMAGGVAHDLNNTLSAVVGYPELLLMQLPEESPLRKPLTTMKEAGERAAAIVADLLTIARGVASTREVVDLRALVRQCLASPEIVSLQNRNPLVEVRKDLAGETGAISCSPIHVKKCILNLIANAFEQVEGGGTLVLETGTQTPDRDLVTRHDLRPGPHAFFRVTDTGRPIADKDLIHIFEPFYTRRVMGKSGGTGLGLSVVWNTMKEHDGAVTVSSGGPGNSFTLYFPPADAADYQLSETEKSEDLRGNGESILVIDDEPHQCELAREILTHYGYLVDCINSGEKAIRHLQNHETDLLVLDMIMAPGINGRQTYEAITKRNPNQRAIIASGFSESEDVRATLRMGASAFIKKPYSMTELALAVRNALAGSPPADAEEDQRRHQA